MKALITGLNGTVAPYLARALIEEEHEVTPWNRARVSPEDARVASAFVRAEKPDVFFHLATGSPDWAELVARICAEEGIGFVFTSSVSVFSAAQVGPFNIEDRPKPDDDYGRYKLECEQRVQEACPEARIIRLGWQIGTQPGGNHMVDHLDRLFREKGRIEASVHWYQACSFLPDTAASLMRIARHQPPGLYHLDGNTGLHFHEIVVGLNQFLGEPWKVEPSELPVQNNLLQDRNVHARPVSSWFQSARTPTS